LELILGEPLFMGQTEAQQLFQIYKFCGTADEDWEEVNSIKLLVKKSSFLLRNRSKRKTRELANRKNSISKIKVSGYFVI
jgi:hypothetical protein